MKGVYDRGKRGKYKRSSPTMTQKKIMGDMQRASTNRELVKQLEGVTFIEYENVKKPINTNIC